jgi:CubicO group peptidase (beta-lactamase class C family)
MKGVSMQRVFLAFILATASYGWHAPASDGQEAPRTVAAPEQDKPSSRLTPTEIAELDARIEQMRRDWEVPGLSVVVVENDQVLLCKGYGFRSIGTDLPVDAHTLFAIASNSKAFTAAALAILVDEGKVRWNDPVSKYLPWLRLSDPLATSDLRVRDLLCHRSGLGTFSGDLLWWGTPYTPREILERSVHLKPEFPFRAGYGYSNLMYLAAGEVIRTASGQSWGDFVQDRILKPLAMDRTRVSVTQLAGMDNVAVPHKTLLDRSVPIPWMNWDSMAAAGGIISSASDMASWLRLQLREGQLDDNKRLFRAESSHEMWQPQTVIPISRGRSIRLPSTHFRAYGLGWVLADYEGVKMVGHSGGYDGMYSEVLMIPERGLGIAVLTNSMTSIGNAIVSTVADRALDATGRDWSGEGLAQFRKSRTEFYERIATATKPVVEGTAPSHALEAYTGLFECPLYGKATVSLEEGKLRMQFLPYGELTATLEHLHYDTFVLKWDKSFAWFEEGTAHFVADAKGQFVRIELNVPNDDLWFHELKLSRTVPSGK